MNGYADYDPFATEEEVVSDDRDNVKYEKIFLSAESSANRLSTAQRVDLVVRQQEEGMALMETLSGSLEAMSISPLFGGHQARLVEYVQKLKSTRDHMSSLSKRTQTMQLTLNKVRQAYPPHKKALLQQGPFQYKCVWQGGIRYREYPKVDAQAKAKMVAFGETVIVAERVYITGENLVYLHVKGTGWLFENKDGITVMRIVPSGGGANGGADGADDC